MASFSGSEIEFNSQYRYHICTTSGSFVPQFSGNIQVLVVAGGGGGGMDMGGGGGGGGVVYHSSYAVTAGSSYTVTVGAGGSGAPAGSHAGQNRFHQFNISATQGGNSVFGPIIAVGGGYGGSSYWGYTPNYGYGGAGGSGGGASGYSDTNIGRGGGVTANTVAGGTGYGNAGGGSGGQYYSGGGGGAGASGAGGGSPNGGAGILNSILGIPLYWGGGGGGSGYSAGSSGGGNGGIGGGGGGAPNGIALPNGIAYYPSYPLAYNPGGNAGPGIPGDHINSPGGDGGVNTGGGGGGGGAAEEEVEVEDLPCFQLA